MLPEWFGFLEVLLAFYGTIWLGVQCEKWISTRRKKEMSLREPAIPRTTVAISGKLIEYDATKLSATALNILSAGTAFLILIAFGLGCIPSLYNPLGYAFSGWGLLFVVEWLGAAMILHMQAGTILRRLAP